MSERLEQQAERSNTTLWILIAVFTVPMIVAYAYYFFVDEYSLGNHGELIEPVVQVEDLSLTDEQGQALARDELVHKWKMLYVADADCDVSCQHTLYNIRQINTALGKNADRFQHMIIHLQPMSPTFEKLVADEYPDALHSHATRDNLSRSLPGFGAADPASHTIYIMDPLGNIMMRFDQGISPKLILNDLNRLLKISRIG